MEEVYKGYQFACTIIMSFIFVCILLQVPIEVKPYRWFGLNIKFVIIFIIKEPYVLFKYIKYMGLKQGVKYEIESIKDLWRLGYFKY